MPVTGKVLEDSIRLSKIRRIKLTLYIVQAGALVGLAFFIVFVMHGAQITPTLYLPIASFVAVVVLLLLIICVESFFFRMLEIRFARSSSARHLMAKNSIKRSLLIALLTGILAIVLAVPSILGALEDARRVETTVTASETPPSFYSSDQLGLMSVDIVEVTAPQTVQVYLVTRDVYEINKGDLEELYYLRLNRPYTQFNVEDELAIRVPSGDFVEYVLVLNDMDHPGTPATFILQKSVSSTFTGVTSLLMIAFVVSNLAWVAYLVPIERKYSAGSIYK